MSLGPFTAKGCAKYNWLRRIFDIDQGSVKVEPSAPTFFVH